MADERFQDFPQKTNPTGSDELVGVDGSGYFRSPVSSLPSSGGFDDVKRQQWSLIFGDKPYREDVWIGAATQSHGAPLNMLPGTFMVESDKVYDWCTGGIDSMAFRTLENMDATGYNDLGAGPYTGHPRKDTWAGTSWPFAVDIAEYFDVDVYVTHTWWTGRGIVTYFYPFQDDDGSGEGDGWTEWATQATASQTALSGATMDIFMFYTGDTDSALCDQEMSVLVNRYYDFIGATEHHLGVIDKDTRHVFYDQPNADIWKGWRPYRTLFQTWAGKDKATFVNTHDATGYPQTVDGVHALGNTQIAWGKIALDTLITGNGLPLAGASEFQRNDIPLGIQVGQLVYDGLTRRADHSGSVGTLGVGGFSLNAAKTELALPYVWHEYMNLLLIEDEIYPIPSTEGAVPNIQNFTNQMRIKIIDAADPSNYEIFRMQGSGEWSGGLPLTAEVPDHKLFTVTSVSTGGTGIPAYGTGPYDGQCYAEALAVQGSSLRWPRSSFDAEPGGYYHNTKPVFNSGFDLPRYVAEGNPDNIKADPSTNLVGSMGSVVFVDDKGRVVDKVEETSGIYTRTLVAEMTQAGEFALSDPGMFGMGVSTDNKCLIDATVHLSGRRIDSQDEDGVYAASYRYLTHYHATGVNYQSGNNFVSTAYGVVNPDNITFAQPAGFNANGNGNHNYLVRGSAFYPPADVNYAYEWTAQVTYVVKIYS